MKKKTRKLALRQEPAVYARVMQVYNKDTVYGNCNVGQKREKRELWIAGGWPDVKRRSGSCWPDA